MPATDCSGARECGSPFRRVHGGISLAVATRRRRRVLLQAAVRLGAESRLDGAGISERVALFCDFVTDARYGWASLCAERFGEAPSQILHDWNSASHVNEFEGRPGRRPLSYDEVQELFDAADGLVDQARRRHRKGALSALRDSALLKTVYAYGCGAKRWWD